MDNNTKNKNPVYWLVLLLAAIVFIGSFTSYISDKWMRHSELTCVISSVDGNRYCVRKTRANNKTTQQAADRIAVVTQKCLLLVNKLAEKHPEDIRAQRLKQRFDPTVMSEILPTDTHTAVTSNKGERVEFCLNRNAGVKHTEDTMIDDETLYFVALHELSHIAYTGEGHEVNYWNTFAWLLHEAEALNLYTPRDYSKTPRSYCGDRIAENPYYNNNHVTV